MPRVFVAMSGGVDSSVAAALLVEEGHDVTGVTMQLWPSSGEEGGCCSIGAVRDAKRVCDALGIPHYALNFRESFEQAVVGPYADAYADGWTPNPCIECNDRLKFSELMAKVAVQGADLLATGHYARIVEDRAGHLSLARAVDTSKDQSYFLYRLTQAQMAHAVFPIGGHRKADVRAMAERLGLHVHDKAESQDVCFAATGHADVVRRRRPDALVSGPIVDLTGRVLGEHGGLGLYTVGQRHGLALSGPDGPFYVTSLDRSRNAVVVGPREALSARRIEASHVVWNTADSDASVATQTRYRMKPVPSCAHVADDRLSVDLDEPVFGVAPGQAVVCYEGDLVLGGGTIERAS